VKISFGELSQKYMEFAKTNKRSWLRDEQMLNGGVGEWLKPAVLKNKTATLLTG